MRPIKFRALLAAVVSVALLNGAGCSGGPRDDFQNVASTVDGEWNQEEMGSAHITLAQGVLWTGESASFGMACPAAAAPKFEIFRTTRQKNGTAARESVLESDSTILAALRPSPMPARATAQKRWVQTWSTVDAGSYEAEVHCISAEGEDVSRPMSFSVRTRPLSDPQWTTLAASIGLLSAHIESPTAKEIYRAGQPIEWIGRCTGEGGASARWTILKDGFEDAAPITFDVAENTFALTEAGMYTATLRCRAREGVSQDQISLGLNVK